MMLQSAKSTGATPRSVGVTCHGEWDVIITLQDQLDIYVIASQGLTGSRRRPSVFAQSPRLSFRLAFPDTPFHTSRLFFRVSIYHFKPRTPSPAPSCHD